MSRPEKLTEGHSSGPRAEVKQQLLKMPCGIETVIESKRVLRFNSITNGSKHER